MSPTIEVHVLSASPAQAGLLSADEMERADRFRFSDDRDTFVATRAALRSNLARHLDCHPKDIRFHTGPHGKPFVEYPPNSGIHFNVSHSNRLALIAITHAGPVGVDLENLQAAESAREEIARRHFSESEFRWLQSRPPSERNRDFCRLWVLKEAIIKADGRGFSMPLEETEMDFTNRPVRAVAGQWWLEELAFVEDYAAAVACRHQCRLLIIDSYKTAG